MELIHINSIKAYNGFTRSLYINDPFFKDNKTDIAVMILNPKGVFYSNSTQKMVGVLHNGQIQCQAVLIHHKNLPDVLMLALFEAREGAFNEVMCLVNYSKKMAELLGCNKLTVAVNGHCNYSIGFLTEGFNEPPMFGQSYNPAYYNGFFDMEGFTPVRFTSYKGNITDSAARIAKFIRHVSYSSITFYKGSFTAGSFDSTMRMYTKLNNDIFNGHNYYYKREEGEDRELFTAMRPLLRDGNLLFALKDNVPIGFILWYPDYNEIVSIHHKTDHNTFLKYTLLKQRPKTIIVAEIGVYPEYENSGLILALFNELLKIVIRKHPKATTVASSWVQDENIKSKKLVSFILSRKSKGFTSYETGV